MLLAYRGYVGPIPAPKKWVFIVGCYNSGTTLLHDILAKHHLIGSMSHEGQMCTNQFVTPRELGIPRLWAIQSDKFRLLEGSTSTSVPTILKRQWGHVFNDSSRPVLLEKSVTNSARVRWLNQHFVSSCFIAIIRNGYAVAEGIHRKTGHSYELSARQWAVSNKIMLQDLEHVPRKLIITYEDLTNTPDRVIHDLANFLELNGDFKAGKLAKQNWSIHGVSSQIRNMNQESLARLRADDKSAIEKEAIKMLISWGYYQQDDPD